MYNVPKKSTGMKWDLKKEITSMFFIYLKFYKLKNNIDYS